MNKLTVTPGLMPPRVPSARSPPGFCCSQFSRLQTTSGPPPWLSGRITSQSRRQPKNWSIAYLLTSQAPGKYSLARQIFMRAARIHELGQILPHGCRHLSSSSAEAAGPRAAEKKTSVVLQTAARGNPRCHRVATVRARAPGVRPCAKPVPRVE